MMIDHEDNSIRESHTDEEEEKKESNGQWKSLKKSLNNIEILAQAFLFILAGSETTATTMAFVGYLLAKNPEIQDKLYEEIKKVFDEHVWISVIIIKFS